MKPIYRMVLVLLLIAPFIFPGTIHAAPLSNIISSFWNTLKTRFQQTAPVIRPTAQPTTFGERINLIVTLTQNPQGGGVAVTNAQAVRGFSPKHPYNPQFAKLYSSYLEQVVNGEVVASFPFRFDRGLKIEGTTPRNGKEEFTGGEIPYDQPTATLEIPYIPGTTLRVRDIKSKVVYDLPLDRIENATRNIQVPTPPAATKILWGNNNSSYTPNQPENNGVVNVVVISSHYTNSNQFFADSAFRTNYLLGYAPFSDLRDQIAITALYTAQDAGCQYTTLHGIGTFTCDTQRVLNIASSLPHDIILIIENDQRQGGSANISSRIAITSLALWPPNWPLTTVHEMGHAVGVLDDEYVYSDFGTYNNEPLGPNCDSNAQCTKWNGSPGCFEGCSYPRGAWRPTLLSIMGDYGGAPLPFYEVNERAIRSQVTAFVNQRDPVGTTETTTQTCTVTGWSCDANSYNSYLNIEIKAGGQSIGTTRANLYNSSAIAACGGNGYHGFQYRLPYQDGSSRTVTASSWDVDTNGQQTGRTVNLQPNRTVTCPAPSPTPTGTPGPTPTPTPAQLSCLETEAWRDDARNTPGHYYTDYPIGPNETLAVNERFVFKARVSPSNIFQPHTVYYQHAANLRIDDYSPGCSPTYAYQIQCIPAPPVTNSGAYIRATVLNNTINPIFINGAVNSSPYPTSQCPERTIRIGTGSPPPAPSGTPAPSPTSTPSPLRGDINHDGHVDLLDFNILLENYGRKNACGNAADLNGDCSIDMLDANYVYSSFGT